MPNFIILTILFLPSILAALSRKKMAAALIAAENTETLVETFKKYEKEQNKNILSEALADVAEVQACIPKVAACLGVAHDSFPDDKTRVSYLVHKTLFEISNSADTESFVNVITSFKPSDVKSLAAIRIYTLGRKDVVNVLKHVMSRYPELIIDNLPNWLASHGFDRMPGFPNLAARGKAFKYLAPFATESVLAKALTIVKRNEHNKLVSNRGRIEIVCCDSQDYFPQDLFDKLNVLLKLAEVRNAPIREALTSLPTVIIDLMLEYATGDIPPNCSDSPPKRTALDCCLIS